MRAAVVGGLDLADFDPAAGGRQGGADQRIDGRRRTDLDDLAADGTEQLATAGVEQRGNDDPIAVISRQDRQRGLGSRRGALGAGREAGDRARRAGLLERR